MLTRFQLDLLKFRVFSHIKTCQMLKMNLMNDPFFAIQRYDRRITVQCAGPVTLISQLEISRIMTGTGSTICEIECQLASLTSQ